MSCVMGHMNPSNGGRSMLDCVFQFRKSFQLRAHHFAPLHPSNQVELAECIQTSWSKQHRACPAMHVRPCPTHGSHYRQHVAHDTLDTHVPACHPLHAVSCGVSCSHLRICSLVQHLASLSKVAICGTARTPCSNMHVNVRPCMASHQHASPAVTPRHTAH